MREVTPVVRWDEPKIHAGWQEQIGHADQPASQHMPEEADGWCVTLSQANAAGDWWLRIERSGTDSIVHMVPTGTTSLSDARAIASASVAALQHGYMGSMVPPDDPYYEDDSYAGPMEHHGWCLCDQCETAAERLALFLQRAAIQISRLHLLGPEVCQHLGLATSRLRFLDVEEESEGGMT